MAQNRLKFIDHIISPHGSHITLRKPPSDAMIPYTPNKENIPDLRLLGPDFYRHLGEKTSDKEFIMFTAGFSALVGWQLKQHTEPFDTYKKQARSLYEGTKKYTGALDFSIIPYDAYYVEHRLSPYHLFIGYNNDLFNSQAQAEIAHNPDMSAYQRALLEQGLKGEFHIPPAYPDK
jgi:hypothetical protein